MEEAGKIAGSGAELKHSGRRVDARLAYHPGKDIVIRRSDGIFFVPYVGIVAVRVIIVVENWPVNTSHTDRRSQRPDRFKQEIAKITKIEDDFLNRGTLAVASEPSICGSIDGETGSLADPPVAIRRDYRAGRAASLGDE
jgi:hypothetical protein